MVRSTGVSPGNRAGTSLMTRTVGGALQEGEVMWWPPEFVSRQA
jgi:hypothetical protein